MVTLCYHGYSISQVHFDLAIYHYMGRFEEAKECDSISAIFHLRTAANCGLSIAEFTLGTCF